MEKEKGRGSVHGEKQSVRVMCLHVVSAYHPTRRVRLTPQSIPLKQRNG
jgi:hypothetical protein